MPKDPYKEPCYTRKGPPDMGIPQLLREARGAPRAGTRAAHPQDPDAQNGHPAVVEEGAYRWVGLGISRTYMHMLKAAILQKRKRGSHLRGISDLRCPRRPCCSTARAREARRLRAPLNDASRHDGFLSGSDRAGTGCRGSEGRRKAPARGAVCMCVYYLFFAMAMRDNASR